MQIDSGAMINFFFLLLLIGFHVNSGEREGSSVQAPHLREEHPKGKARERLGRVRCQRKVPTSNSHLSPSP